MKLFVSYRRATWDFTYWLVEELGKLLDANIFVDYSGIDQANFTSAITNHLSDCTAFLLIVTEHTFAPDRIHRDDDWVRHEIREALRQAKPIVMALRNGLTPPPDLPADIRAVQNYQGIEFYSSYFKAGVNRLADFIARSTPIPLRQNVAVAPLASSSAPRNDKSQFNEATALAEAGEYERALSLLRDLRQRDYKPFFYSLDDLITRIDAQLSAERRRWEAGEAYDDVAAAARLDKALARQAWAHFRQTYPEHTDDPADLARLLAETPEPVPRKVAQPPPEPKLQSAAPAPRIEVAQPPPAPRTPQLGDRRTDEKTGAIMVYVPPGMFMMGSDNGRDDEKPVHEQVIAQGFWLDLTPVTNAAYAVFVAAGGYRQRDWWTAAGWAWREEKGMSAPKDWDGFTTPDQPRVGITWYEAWAFAAWRGGRLPTEAEWEWAARGPENRVYAWGDNFVGDLEYVIYGGNSGDKTHPVGEGIRLKGAAWCGALDMSGNVREWVSSLYKPYPYNAADGRESVDGTGARVLRGGSWGSRSDYLRCAYRFRGLPDYWSLDGGFRLALS